MSFVTAALDPATAALIGAGAASLIGLVAQYLAHRLSTLRDRRNARRERFRQAVMEAAYALARVDEPPLELDPDRDPPDVHTPDALRPWSEAMHEYVGGWSKNTMRAWFVLGITFGHNHWLVEEYLRVRIERLEAQRAEYVNRLKIEQSQDADAIRRLEDKVGGLAQRMVKATQECEAWTARALAVVDKT